MGVVEARISAAPSQSMIGFRRGLGSRRRFRQHNSSASNPNGRLIQKIQCQDKYSAKKPPSTGPSTFEIAMTLAMSPKVLLLDEPLAGMGPEEAERMTALIGRLGSDHAVLLVEHDMDAVFRVAETLTVMADGKVLESGAPAKVRASAAVQEAYLGNEQLE